MEPITHRGVTTPVPYKSDGLTKIFNKYKPRSIMGAIWHDYCCETMCISWKEAAKGMKELWKENGVSLIRRNYMYSGVRAWGWVSFKKGAY